MNAETARELYSDYLEGTLDPNTKREMERFLAETPLAQKELVEFEKMLSLMHRLPPREPSLDLWREFAPHMAEWQKERKLGWREKMATGWMRTLSQISTGLILWTHAVADRTHARLERYLLNDPTPQYERSER